MSALPQSRFNATQARHLQAMASPPTQSPSPSPRPFPPPALADVPLEYIVDQLHNLAPRYWNKLDTTDCTIIIPLPRRSGAPVSSSVDPNDAARRVADTDIHSAPCLTHRLHVDYLCAKSTLLRSLFSGVPFTQPPSSLSLQVPQNRMPRLGLSGSHPVLFLPVPDPHSIHLLFHWMYFGGTAQLEMCLDQGRVQWEGLARNVEYLGLTTDIKVFLGRWYDHWLLPARRRPACRLPSGTDDDSDADLEYEDDEDDEEAPDDSGRSSSSSHTDEEDFPERGRPRITRPLTQLCGQFRACAC